MCNYYRTRGKWNSNNKSTNKSGIKIYFIDAKDNDHGTKGNLNFGIKIPNHDNENIFTIKPKSNVIETKKIINKMGQYLAILTAFDNSEKPCTSTWTFYINILSSYVENEEIGEEISKEMTPFPTRSLSIKSTKEPSIDKSILMPYLSIILISMVILINLIIIPIFIVIKLKKIY